MQIRLKINDVVFLFISLWMSGIISGKILEGKGTPTLYIVFTLFLIGSLRIIFANRYRANRSEPKESAQENFQNRE